MRSTYWLRKFSPIALRGIGVSFIVQEELRRGKLESVNVRNGYTSLLNDPSLNEKNLFNGVGSLVKEKGKYR